MAVSYGRGLTGLAELRLDGSLTRGLEAVIRDVYHMLVTVRGSLPADPEAGLGLLDLVLGETSTESLPAIAADIESELLKDDRVETVDATVTATPDGGLVIDIQVDLAAGPSFRLVGPISSVRAEMITNA